MFSRAKVVSMVVGAVFALVAGPVAAQEDAAQKAVEAAKQYSGTTITEIYEAALQALLPINYQGPEWERLTGIKVHVIELPYEDLFSKTLLEHRGGTGAYDVLNVIPALLPDLARAGALEPLDPYIEKYGVASEFDDINPVFRNWMTFNGKTYGLVDDGDILLVYYRKDLFADPANQSEFKAQYGYELSAPTDWKQFAEICHFLTAKYAPKLYGCGMNHTPDIHFFFSERFRAGGGKFFDAETMKAAINSEIGVKALTDLVALIKDMPPGAATWGFVENLNALLAGQIAMHESWPPLARWAQGIDENEEALSWVPKSQVKDKIAYALPPGGHSELAGGYVLALSPDSKNKEAAYLYMQWCQSKRESLKSVMRPVGLRDPYRLSHYDSSEYQALWPSAKEYLDVLRDGAAKGLEDLSIISAYKYQESLGRAVVAAIGGEDPKKALDDLAAEWDGYTEQIGLDKQREAYRLWAEKSSAYP